MEISDNVDLQKLNRNRLQNVLKNRLGRNDNKIDVTRKVITRWKIFYWFIEIWWYHNMKLSNPHF